LVTLPASGDAKPWHVAEVAFGELCCWMETLEVTPSGVHPPPCTSVEASLQALLSS
jgi:hypothetical protein